MDFALSDEQIMFRDSVAAFARKELADGALARAHSCQGSRATELTMYCFGLQ